MSSASAEEEERERRARAILRSFFLGVFNFVLLLPAELQVAKKLLRGDLAKTSRFLAASAGMSGLVEFLLNPTFGALSDRIGRRPFFLLGPAYVALGNASLAIGNVAKRDNGLWVLLINSFLRKVSATVSGSVASVTALSDVASGRQFAIYISKLWACAGAGVVCAPMISGYLESAYGPQAVFAAAALGGCAQFVHNFVYVPETLDVVAETTTDDERPRSWNDVFVNPFRCLKILVSDSTVLRTAALSCMFGSFIEGKNMSGTNALYVRNECGLHPSLAGRYVALYGCAMYVSGQYVGPALLKHVGPRAFTTFANVCNTIAFAIQSQASDLKHLMLALAFLFTGINANSMLALKAIAGRAAIQSGYSRGLFNGHFVRSILLLIVIVSRHLRRVVSIDECRTRSSCAGKSPSTHHDVLTDDLRRAVRLCDQEEETSRHIRVRRGLVLWLCPSRAVSSIDSRGRHAMGGPAARTSKAQGQLGVRCLRVVSLQYLSCDKQKNIPPLHTPRVGLVIPKTYDAWS